MRHVKKKHYDVGRLMLFSYGSDRQPMYCSLDSDLSTESRVAYSLPMLTILVRSRDRKQSNGNLLCVGNRLRPA